MRVVEARAKAQIVHSLPVPSREASPLLSGIHNTLTCQRALLASLLRRPSLWIVAAGTAGAGWILHLALPFGLTTQRSHQLAFAYELAFLAGTVGASLALSNAVRFRPALEPSSPIARLAATTTTSLIAAAMVGACAIVPAHQLREWQSVAFETRASLVALALGWTAFASLGGCVAEWLRGPGAHLTAPGVALAATLLLPAALPEWLAPLFGSSALLRATFDLSAEPADWRAPVWSTLLWGSMAIARAVPPSDSIRGHATHALRDPR